MNEQEKRQLVTDELGKIYPQLQINCRKTCGGGYQYWGEDLLAMCLEMFLEKETDYIYKVYTDGKLENFITFMMGFQLKSSSSRFWHRYRKERGKYRELYENTSVVQKRVEHNKAFENEPSLLYLCMRKEIDKLNPYHKMIVEEMMIQGNNFKKTSEKYRINYYSLKKDYKQLQTQIGQACKHLRS